MSARDEVLARIRSARGDSRQHQRASEAPLEEHDSSARDATTTGSTDASTDASTGDIAAGEPAYRTRDHSSQEELVERLVEMLTDYKARVRVVPSGEVAAEIEKACRERGAERMLVPPGFPTEWIPGSAAGESVVSEPGAGGASESVASGSGAGGPGAAESGADVPGAGEIRAAVPASPGFAIAPDDGTTASLTTADGVITTCALAIAQTGTLVLDGRPGQGRRALSLIPDYHLCVVPADRIVGLVPEAIRLLHAAVADGRPLTFISGPSATSDIELMRVEGVHGPRNLEVLIVDRDA